MVDAEDLVLVDDLEDLLVERACGVEVGAERLLDDDAAELVLALLGPKNSGAVAR